VGNFYSTCSTLDHSFRVSVYSHWQEWSTALGGTRLPTVTERIEDFRILIGEFKKDGFYAIDLADLVVNMTPFLLFCQTRWTFSKLALNPRGAS